MLDKINNQELIKNQSIVAINLNNNVKQDILTVTNPFNQAVLAELTLLDTSQLDKVIEISEQSQKNWVSKTANERSQLLQAWADLIDSNKEDLATLMTLEQGKPLKESRGEIYYANSYIRWYAEEGKRVYGDTIPPASDDLRYVVLKAPIGVCAAITPWNFPAAMITRKVAPALAVGCTMIVKPAEDTPLTALALGELALQAGIPQGVLQVIVGESKSIGETLCADPRVKKLSFTGSTAVGKILMAQSAKTVKKLSLELGGNAPFIVFDDADLTEAVDGLILSKYRNAGQTCVCANRIFVQDSIKDEFTKRLVEKVKNLKVGDGLQNSTDIGPLINQKALDKVTQLVTDAMQKGANVIVGGKRDSSSDLSFQPTILSDIQQNMDIAYEEIFGPVIPLIIFSNEDEVIDKANDSIYGLAAYFYTKDHARAWRVTEQLEYGMVGHNTGLISNAAVPFGGIKQSGFGREGSKYGLEDYLVTKYWCTKVS